MLFRCHLTLFNGAYLAKYCDLMRLKKQSISDKNFKVSHMFPLFFYRMLTFQWASRLQVHGVNNNLGLQIIIVYHTNAYCV